MNITRVKNVAVEIKNERLWWTVLGMRIKWFILHDMAIPVCSAVELDHRFLGALYKEE